MNKNGVINKHILGETEGLSVGSMVGLLVVGSVDGEDVGSIDVDFVNETVNEQLQALLSTDEYELQTTIISSENKIRFDVFVLNDDNIADLNEESIEDGIQETLNSYDDDIVYSVNASFNAQDTSITESDNSHFILFVIAAVLVIVIVFAYIYSKYIYVNDYFKVGSLLTAGIHIMDAISDILFVMAVTYNIILILGIIFIVVPILITLYQLYQAISKWRRNDELNQWISDNVQILYLSLF